MIDLNLVRVFVKVYQLGSYTKAAEKLELSQPAVSLSIKRLEKYIGYKLFAKKGRGVEATSQAKILANELESGLLKIDNAISPSKDLSTYCAEAVLHFIGGVEGVRFLPSPEILELELEHLRTNVVDLVLGITDSTDPAFVVEKLTKEKMVVVCRNSHPRIQGETLTKEQFLGEELVIFKSRQNGLQLIDLYTKEPLPQKQERVEASSIASVVTMVASTNYLGVVTESFAEHWKGAMNLRVLDYPFESNPVTFQLIYHTRNKSNPHHIAVRDAIKSRLKKHGLL